MKSQRLHVIWRSLFGTPFNAITTLVCLVLLYALLKPFGAWAVVDAVWHGNAQSCRADGAGACWVYIGEKLRFFLFGYYPFDAQWRAGLALALIVLLPLGLALSPAWRRRGLPIAVVTLVLVAWLLLGGVGLAPIEAAKIGGLLLSMLLAGASLVLGFPLGLLLALGRSATWRVLRWPSVGVVELFRSSPLVNVLIIASVVAPLLFPSGSESSKLSRVLVAFTIMAAAYIADALRGGLQAIHPSQLESATAIGMGYWQRTLLVSAPQAIVYSVPALANVGLSFFKETSLVTVVGMVDFLGGVQLAARDTAWLGFELEGYVFAALVYFLTCWVMAAIFRRVEAGTRFTA